MTRNMENMFLDTYYIGVVLIGRGDDSVWKPSWSSNFSFRAQISQFELFELMLFLKLDEWLPVERFEATVSQSTVASPLLSFNHFQQSPHVCDRCFSLLLCVFVFSWFCTFFWFIISFIFAFFADPPLRSTRARCSAPSSAAPRGP